MHQKLTYPASKILLRNADGIVNPISPTSKHSNDNENERKKI